ncbi:MAG: hypothetical protein H0T73_05050 [Ardenticatenales bacterium]|nr:hypothetical protein [Ardenticatenales bacterium]
MELHVGQMFVITNPDYHIRHEVWEIVQVVYPDITFSNTKYNLVDIAYVQYTSTETVIGTVFKEEEDGVIIAFPGRMYCEVGFLLSGDKATYLNSLDPIVYA